MENIKMTIREADRLGVMREVDLGKLNLKQASQEMGVSLKQARRIRKRYAEEGEQGLISRHRGRPCNRKTPDSTRQKVIYLLQNMYTGFGPTLAAEKLTERDDIKLSAETIRKWMMQEGLWQSGKRKTGRVYQRRQRRSRFGELIQGDGSPHDWFEGRGDKCTLLQFVDDATSKITAALFVPSETTNGYKKVLRQHLKQYGRPLALYVDKHGSFRVNRKELKNGTGITHFGSICKELGIEIICANSPQAKGRVERKNSVMQDRLIKEMRLQGISTIDAANDFLPRFIDSLNQRFGIEAAEQEDAHRALRSDHDLDNIFAYKEERKLSKNLTFQYEKVLYLIETKTPNRLRHATIEVSEIEGQPLQVRHNGTPLSYKAWEDIHDERPAILGRKEVVASPLSSTKRQGPGKYHPWR